MRLWPLIGLAGFLLLALSSCAPGSPQLMPKETLFPLELGALEDQIDLFQRTDLSTPERDRFLFLNGLVVVSDGNARKVMEFSSYGDLLTLFYSPDSNLQPFLGGAAAGGGTDQVKNRRAFSYPFNELGEIGLTEQNQLYVEDRVPAERRVFDPDLKVVLQSRILRFGHDGKFLDFLGQEGIGGKPFPSLDTLTVTANGELVVISRTGVGWAVWWYDRSGSVVAKTVFPYDSLPLPDGSASKTLMPQLQAVRPDWRQRALRVKVDYYHATQDLTTKTASGIQLAQSRIWTYDMESHSYRKSYVLPVLKRQKTKGDTSEPIGDRPFDFIGSSEGELDFFLSSPEAGSQRFLVCRPDGSAALERNIELRGADTAFAQFTVTRSGILVGFLSDGNRAEIAWWRSDKLLGTNGQAGF